MPIGSANDTRDRCTFFANNGFDSISGAFFMNHTVVSSHICKLVDNCILSTFKTSIFKKCSILILLLKK